MLGLVFDETLIFFLLKMENMGDNLGKCFLTKEIHFPPTFVLMLLLHDIPAPLHALLLHHNVHLLVGQPLLVSGPVRGSLVVRELLDEELLARVDGG